MTNKEKEIRSLSFEVREIDETTRVIKGVVNAYGSVAEFGDWDEVVVRGAFTESLSTGDQLALYNHDSGRLLGRVSSGTLKLNDDETRLAFELSLPNTSDGNDVMELVKRGDLNSMSFGFFVRDEEWTDEYKHRFLKRLDLIEVSIVARPAYPNTDAALRSKDHAQDIQKNKTIKKLHMRLSVAKRKRTANGKDTK